MAASLVGQKLGKYDITQLIGHGGMATVYKGHQVDIDRNVAIKVLPPHPGQDAQFVERFRLEARTIARLQHPHILPLYDYGDENGVLYLVMAFIDGGSVSDRIRRGAQNPKEIETLLKQVAGALDYAHRQGVIHRDIKPDNILLDREGHALLADFGIVKLVEGSTSGTGSALTVTGGLVGTPAYMSPEQAQGLPVDGRSDIYSLGVVVFELLTGKQPFTADTPMQVVFKHVNAPIPPVRDLMPSLPAGMNDVMRRVLAKHPAERYATAQAFAEDFSRALRGDPTITPTPGGYTVALPRATGEAQVVQPTTAASTTPYPPGMYQTPYPPGTYPPGYAPPQTIITQQGLNPVVVLGGFAIIAVLLVVIVFLVVSQNAPPSNPPPIPTEPAVVREATRAPEIAPPQPTFGKVSFSTGTTLGDTITLQLENVRQPPSGENYVAWLKNTVSGTMLRLGTINVDGLGSGVFSYTSADGSALPTLYNAVLITHEDGLPDAPSADVVYSGYVPIEVTHTLGEILIGMKNMDDPIPEGVPEEMQDSLINAALAEARIGQRHAGLAAGARTVGSMHTHAEHTVNILRGTNDDLDGNGRAENPGRGFGVLYFLNAMWEHLDAAAQVPDSTRMVQSQVELIRICTQNAITWVDQIIALESEMLAADDLEAMRPQMVQSTELAQALIAGTDLNGNQQVDPFEGECGLEQIITYGVYVGNMDINAGSFEE